MDLEELKKVCLRSIPSVESILGHSVTKDKGIYYPRWALIEGIRKILEQKRAWIVSETIIEKLQVFQISIDDILEELQQSLTRFSSCEIKKIINGTGIILHTNLGRAILAQEVVEKLSTIAGSYSNLEFDLITGNRGKRGEAIIHLLKQLTGAQEALVVNNNAAAVLLVLNTLARAKEVIVSRGEMVEIGGSFRIPEIIREGGARLVEVGTTNKTRLDDYQRAISQETAAILKVHPGNYRVIGFTEEVPLLELVRLGKESGLAVIYDLGSGAMVDLAAYGLEDPLVSKAVREGSDIITFSGDKLLGGPQAGLILCKEKYAKALRENPLMRALRPDKMTLACLENTLKLYQAKDVLARVPVLRMITASYESLKEKGKGILEGLKDIQPDRNLQIEIIDDVAEVGGGSFPGQGLPSLSIAFSVVKGVKGVIEHLAERLRWQSPPVLGRIYQNQFRLNLHTIQEDDIKDVIEKVGQVIRESGE